MLVKYNLQYKVKKNKINKIKKNEIGKIYFEPMHSSEHLGMTCYCCLHCVLSDFGEVSEGYTACTHCLTSAHP